MILEDMFKISNYFYVLLIKNIYLYSLRITVLPKDYLAVHCLISKYFKFSR